MSDVPRPTSAVLLERLLARLRLRHLKLVDALALHSHLGRAADAVHISQPAATQMLRELEEMIGVALFERHARGMRITEAGRLLALHARMAVDALRVVADGVNAMRAPDRAMLIITHYQRLLDYIRPDRVHVMTHGRIVASGGPELALELEKSGYDKYLAEAA